MLSPEERARALAVAEFGEDAVRASERSDMYVVTENGDEQADFGEFYDLAIDLEGLVPIAVLRKLAQGQFSPSGMTLERTFLLYRKFKEASDPQAQQMRELEGRLERLRKDITAALGESFFKQTNLSDIRRKDANDLRDAAGDWLAVCLRR